MINSKTTILVLLAVFALSACMRDKREPGRVFMPDMNYSLAYDAYTSNPNFADSLTSRAPVAGTIARGTFNNDSVNSINFRYAAYSEDSVWDYENAGTRISNPIQGNEVVLAEGQRLYNINCAICHGEKGEGDGFIVENEKGRWLRRLGELVRSDFVKILDDGGPLPGRLIELAINYWRCVGANCLNGFGDRLRI